MPYQTRIWWVFITSNCFEWQVIIPTYADIFQLETSFLHIFLSFYSCYKLVSFHRIHEPNFDLILHVRCVVFLTTEPKATFSVYTHAKSINVPALMSFSFVGSWRFYLLNHCDNTNGMNKHASKKTDNMQSSWGWWISEKKNNENQ